jgi:membrane-associated phospholipid phosphatase
MTPPTSIDRTPEAVGRGGLTDGREASALDPRSRGSAARPRLPLLEPLRPVSVAALVTALVLYHLLRKERREAIAWAVVGLGTFVVPELIKHVTARPRPELWEMLIHPSGFAMPSGHAAASGAFYPLLGWALVRAGGGAAAVGPAGGPLHSSSVRSPLPGWHWRRRRRRLGLGFATAPLRSPGSGRILKSADDR